MKYVVSYFTIEIKDGQSPITDSQDFEFTNENPLEARRAAIAKAKELENNSVADDTFDSPAVAAAKDFKNTKGFSIDIWLFDGDEDEHGFETEIQIMGDDEEEQIYSLESEVELYLTKGLSIETSEVENDDDFIEVIAENWQFLLNS